MKAFIVGTAGHIDHGKSALVKALTGIDPDRLIEEKERGITIDIGFSYFYLKDNSIVSFVDVPGHEKFIKNMIAGAVGIDAVMLVVAANESVKPQTIEHLRICKLLGLKRGFVALTKIDLVDDAQIELAKFEIKKILENTFLEGAPIIPVSSVTLLGIEEIKKQIENLKTKTEGRPVDSYFRMPVDRAFIIKGFGLILTGTVFEGVVKKNQEVQVMPTFNKCRVKNIQMHNQNRLFAQAGSRAALNLSGIEKEQIVRGYFLVAPDVFSLSNMIEAEIYIFDEFKDNISKLKKLKFYHGTSENMCDVNYIDKIDENSFYAQIILQNPSLFLLDDRFILRTFSPVATIGGGCVINISNKKYKKKEYEKISSELKEYSKLSIWDRLNYWIEHSFYYGVRLSFIISRTGATKEKILSNLSKYANIKIILAKDYLMISNKNYLKIKNDIFNEIRNYQLQNRFEKGIPKAKLKSMYADQISNELFISIITELVNERKIQTEDDYLFIEGLDAEFLPYEKQTMELILKIFNDFAFSPPYWKEIEGKVENKALANKVLQYLINKNELIKIGDDLYYHKDYIKIIKEKLLNFFEKGDELEINQFKSMFELSRKYAIPLLEYFDKKGFTIRVGDKRKLGYRKHEE